MVAAMGAEAHSPRPGGATLMTRLADVLVVQAVRWWLDHDTERCSGWLMALRDPKVGKALALIHRRPEERWTVGTLAREVHLSRSVFSARFTELVGTPPMQYLTRWRMHLAGRWLREEKLGISEVAARFGYESEPSFSRAFKRYMGVSPGAARRGATEWD
jgi:AraC-like DNA-binding protein